MDDIEQKTIPKKIFTSSWAAFYLYYFAMGICWLGPQINPAFAARIFLTPLVGFFLGLLLLGGVIYLKYGQQYELDSTGVKINWLYPPRQQLIRWQEISSIKVRAGLTQTILGIGNIAIQPREGEEMVWYGLESPKMIKTILERDLDESTAE